MNCLESHDLLQRRLDGESLADSLALEQHLAGCRACRRTHAAGALMLEGLKVLPQTAQSAEPPVDFADKMVGKILRDRVHRQARMRRRVWVTAGLAAAILVMVWAGNIWLPEGNAPKVVVIVPNPPNPPAVVPDKPAPPVPPEEKVVPLARRSVDEALDPATQSLRQAGQGVSEGVQTVSRNARRAVSFFLKELPVLDTAN